MTLKLKTGEPIKSERELKRFLKEMSNIEFQAYVKDRGDILYNWIDKKVSCSKKCQDLLDSPTRQAMLLVLGKEQQPRLQALENELEKDRKRKIKKKKTIKKFRTGDKKLKIEPQPSNKLIEMLKEVYK